MCPHLSANYVLGCPSNMAQVSVWAGNLQLFTFIVKDTFWALHNTLHLSVVWVT